MTGYGECTAFESPLFNHETIDTAWSVISNFIAPMLAKANVSSVAEVGFALKAIQGKPNGNRRCRNGDLGFGSEKSECSAWKHLGGTRDVINCGVSIGLQKTPEVLLEKVTHEIESGYQRIKLKIKPGQDIELVKKIRSHFPDILLSVDANSAYDYERDLEIFEELRRFRSADDRTTACRRRFG